MKKEVVFDIAKVLDSISKLDFDINSKRDVLDFKSNKAELLRKQFENYYHELLKLEKEFRNVRYNDIVDTFENVKRAYEKQDFAALKTHILNLQLLLPQEEEKRFDINVRLPADIKPELSADIQEVRKCYDAGCYRGAVVLCGRVLEAALHRKYYEATGQDILETNPAIGLGKLIAKLRDHSVKFPPGITEQIHLINKVRISSVHKKQQVFMPSQQQANAIILYTLDVLGKLF
ncbi:hypothetical protein KY337_06155 [Candidatus Woesearchaeota archaeon]|nr:hypothetical protein [Candidatus Woesearchaeota archaeon]